MNKQKAVTTPVKYNNSNTAIHREVQGATDFNDDPFGRYW